MKIKTCEFLFAKYNFFFSLDIEVKCDIKTNI